MKKFLLATASLLLALHPVAAPAQVVHDYKTVSDVIEDGYRPCFFFMLDGVTNADPGVASVAPMYFAIPRTHMAFAEVFALVLTARVLRLTVRVNTTGTLSCGMATVDGIYIRG